MKTIELQPDEMVIKNKELSTLLKRVDEAEANEAVLKDCAISIMTLMGLIDPETKKIKPEIASGEESFVPGMLKSLMDVVSLLTKSNMSKIFGGEKAKKELNEKFGFVNKLIPLINKHAQ